MNAPSEFPENGTDEERRAYSYAQAVHLATATGTPMTCSEFREWAKAQGPVEIWDAAKGQYVVQAGPAAPPRFDPDKCSSAFRHFDHCHECQEFVMAAELEATSA